MNNGIKVKDYKNNNISYSGVDILPVIIGDNGPAKSLGYFATCSYSVHTNFSPVNTCGSFSPKSFVRGTRLIAGSFVSVVFDKAPLYELRNTSYETFYTPTSGHLPVFDILLVFNNEYSLNQSSVMKICGVRIMDEGQVHSIDDIYTENTMSFVAEDIQLLNTDAYNHTSWKESGKEYIFESSVLFATGRTYKGIAEGMADKGGTSSFDQKRNQTNMAMELEKRKINDLKEKVAKANNELITKFELDMVKEEELAKELKNKVDNEIKLEEEMAKRKNEKIIEDKIINNEIARIQTEWEVAHYKELIKEEKDNQGNSKGLINKRQILDDDIVSG